MYKICLYIPGTDVQFAVSTNNLTKSVQEFRDALTNKTPFIETSDAVIPYEVYSKMILTYNEAVSGS